LVEDLAAPGISCARRSTTPAAGRPLTTAFARPYGRSIKYADQAASKKT